jgi:sugar lactone lactonase YvrE
MSKIAFELAVHPATSVGEGLFYDIGDGGLHFTDIVAGRLFRFDPTTGDLAERHFGEPLGCLALDQQGQVVGAFTSGIHRIDRTGTGRTRIAELEPDRPANRPNDGAVDRQGRFWIGTMKKDAPAARSGAFYRLDGDGSIRRMRDGYFTTNGLAFSPDGRTMYFSDSNPDVRVIWSCSYDPDSGEPGDPRPFFDTRAVAGRPDGATVDADGCYWMAGVGGWQLVRLTPAGIVDRIIDLPVERPSRPWFGGPRLDTLYVTTLSVGLTAGSEARQPWSGGVIAVTGLGVTGLAQPRFAG